MHGDALLVLGTGLLGAYIAYKAPITRERHPQPNPPPFSAAVDVHRRQTAARGRYADPNLRPWLRRDGYALATHPSSSVQQGAPRDPSAATGTAFMLDGEISRAQYHWLWPNVTINIDPGPQNLSLDVWLPDGPGRTRGFTEYFFGADVPDDTVDDIMAFSRQVAEEDTALVEAVQRGMASGAVETGRLMPRSEKLVAHFQRLVLAALRARSAAR